MAEDMAQLVSRLQTGPVHVVGISMGGTTALQLALDHPGLVERLVLVNTFASLRFDQPSTLFYFAVRYLLIHATGLPTQARVVARRLFPKPEQDELRQKFYEQVIQANPRGYRAAMRSLARFDVRRRLREIDVPTLVITGEQDGSIPIKIQRRLAEGIPGSRQVIIPSAGHGVTVDQPEAFNRILLDFLLDKTTYSP
jgi:pimeloyl-ACP methyl ester carboxylesterase